MKRARAVVGGVKAKGAVWITPTHYAEIAYRGLIATGEPCVTCSGMNFEA
jgi:hypothetical protein